MLSIIISPQSYEPNKKLGAWVGKQRESYNKQLISQEKVDLLESIGFVWSRRVVSHWEEMYNNLKAYREVVRLLLYSFCLLLVYYSRDVC